MLKPFLCVIVIAYIINTNSFVDFLLPAFPEIDSSKIWNTEKINISEEIRPIIIKVPDNILETLKKKLESRTLSQSMPKVNFTYGFNPDYLEIMISHWILKYAWHDWEKKINTFPHFYTNINGLQLHFIHVRPILKRGQRSVPILLLHGWPGSFFEFYKVIPMLTNLPENEEIVYEVICPSIPGYGWSDAPAKPGFGITATSIIMFKLMERLNITEMFYIQGGDIGSLVASSMAKINPHKVAGIHINLIEVAVFDIRYWIKLTVGAFLPNNIHFLSEEDQNMIYPYCQKIQKIMNQMGYFWLQKTRPNTIGIALSDSPSGLAAYILEKFGAWSNNLDEHLSSPHGGLENISISKDEMLTNVMIYYITNSISSSIRMYKEFFNEEDSNISKYPVNVPAALALFPKEIAKVPKEFAKYIYRDIRQFTKMPTGGHFAALEEPSLLVKDLKSFVNTIELISQQK